MSVEARSLAMCSAAFVFIALGGCAQPSPAAPAQPAPPAQPVEQAPTCGAPAALQGMAALERPDGTILRYRVWGPSDAPTLVYLHGGPGYDAYGFERTVGPGLGETLQLVTLDQRGCGRSPLGEGAAAGMDPTVADLEALREELGVTRWVVLGHSFGGLVAQAYGARHPDAVSGLILVESTNDLSDALVHQVQTAATRFPDHAEALAETPDATPIERLLRAYEVLGAGPLQASLHWHDADARARAEALDAEAELARCTSPAVFATYRDEGWFDDPNRLPKPQVPAVVIGGRSSEVIGAENLEATATALGAPLVWVDDAGHFPFVEAPAEFTALVVDWTRRFNGG